MGEDGGMAGVKKMKTRVRGKGRIEGGKIIGNRGDGEMDCISVKGTV